MSKLYFILSRPTDNGVNKFQSNFSSKKPNKSPVWKYFDDALDKRNATCKLCYQNIQRNGNTTNLLQHLKTKHVGKWKVVQAEKSGSKQKAPSGCGDINESSEIVDDVSGF